MMMRWRRRTTTTTITTDDDDGDTRYTQPWNCFFQAPAAGSKRWEKTFNGV